MKEDMYKSKKTFLSKKGKATKTNWCHQRTARNNEDDNHTHCSWRRAGVTKMGDYLKAELRTTSLATAVD